MAERRVSNMGKVIALRPKPAVKLGSVAAWGSATHHQRYMAPIDKSARRRCSRCAARDGVKARATHAGMANGVCLMTGCEWHVRQWVKTGG